MTRAGSVRMTAVLFAALLSASSFGQAPSQPPNQAAGHPSSGVPTQAQPQAKQVPPLVRVTTRLVQGNVLGQVKKGEPGTLTWTTRVVARTTAGTRWACGGAWGGAAEEGGPAAL